MNLFKKSLFLVLIIFISLIFNSSKVAAQDDQLDSLQFEPIQTESGRPPYFAIAGGYTGTFLNYNFDAINNFLATKNLGLPKLSGPIYMSGVQGFTALGLIKNLRIGFLGMKGSKLVKNIDVLLDTANSIKGERGFEYTVGYNAFNFDYGIILFKSLAVLPGFELGWGDVVLESYQSPDRIDWQQTVTNPTNGSYLNRTESTFTYLHPKLNIEWAMSPFLMLRGSVGYAMSFSLSGDMSWINNRKATVTGVPKEINGSGLTFQIGIFAGLFNY